MDIFFKSSLGGQGKNQHYHMMYLDKATGKMLVAINNNHKHETEPNVDPQTGQPDGTYKILPDPYDGHTHDSYEAYKPKVKKKKEDDGEVVERVYTLFKTAYENDVKSIKDGKESEQFYLGKQWDKAVKDALESQGRACLTLNITQRKIDDLIGYQRQQRTDLRFVPIEGGDQRVCDILNIWSKVILEQCYFEQEESAVFEDQVIPGRGAFNVYVDFANDIRGDIKVERFPWDQVVWGSHEKINGSDAEYLVKSTMVSLAKLKSRYPKQFDDIEKNYGAMIEINTEDHNQYSSDQYLKSENVTPVMLSGMIPMVDIALKTMRVFELQEKVYLDSSVISDSTGNNVTNATNWKASDLNQIGTIEGLFVIAKKITKIRITRVCGGVLLSDENPAELPCDEFFVIPVYGKKKRNRFWGKVEIAKDAQREINKRASQAIDIGNRMASYGWFYDDSTFSTDAERENFKTISSRPGFIQKVTNINQPPTRIEGVKFPSEIVGLMDMAQARLEQLIDVSSIHKAGANTSASAILQAEKSQLQGTEGFFDNLTFAKKTLGRLLIALCQKYYSGERIYRIVANQNTNNQVMLADQEFDTYQPQEIIQMLDDADLSKVDVAVTEAGWSPTQRIATATILTDALSKGAPIPFQAVIPFLDMPESVKQNTLKTIEAQQAQDAAVEKAKADSEIQKGLIAKGLFPPKVMQEQGLEVPKNQPVSPPEPNSQPQDPNLSNPSSVNSLGGVS